MLRIFAGGSRSASSELLLDLANLSIRKMSVQYVPTA